MTELWQQSATKIVEQIRLKKTSAIEVTQSVLGRLDDVNPAINAVVTHMPEEALATAARVDEAIARGEDPGILGGVPITIKVNTDQKGHVNTNGLKMQKDNVTPEDHTVVANIKKAGAVIVGRTNTPAFSMRWFTRKTIHGHTRNPHNAAITPGGSSGGAAAAVASGIGPIGHGSDIAGSIRYPAYACGIHGIRPSLGRIPAVNPSAPDRHIGGQITSVQGPLARTIDDVQLGLHAMSARDVRDPWWAPVPHDLGTFEKKVAMCINPDELAVVPEVEAAVKAAADRLSDAGWEVTQIPCPALREPAELQILLWMSEARRNGVQLFADEDDPDATFVFEQFERNNPAPDSDGLLDLLKARARLTREWMGFLEDYPVVLTPVSAELPFKDNEDVESSEAFARIIEAQMPQIGLPFMGIPGLTVTTGIADAVPVGVQLIASRYREDILFAAGRDIESRGDAIVPVTPGFS